LLRSQRVFTDLSFALLMGNTSDNTAEKNVKFDMQIVCREWCDEILPEWEFRAFIWQGKFTACTQYYSECYVPEMAANKEKITEKIRQFLTQEILPKLPKDLHTLTIDLALAPDLSRVWLVEIGNPPPVAGTSLFCWDLEADRKIIMGEKSFEFRILDGIPIGAWEKLYPPVRRVLLQERGLEFPEPPKTAEGLPETEPEVNRTVLNQISQFFSSLWQ